MKDDFFLERKSCRFFKPEKIDLATIEKIVEKAAKAPTCGNMQLYSVILTEDEDKKRKLSAFHYNQPAVTTSPLILTICADFNRFTKWCEENKADAGYDNFHSFLMAMTDAIILAQQITTIAEMEGLGTCYLGTVTYNAKEISELLKLPDLVVPVASLAIGKIDKEGDETKRLPLKGFLHFEEYTPQEKVGIKEIYKIHDEDQANQSFIKENNKENLAQVFAEVRYPKNVNLEISEKFMNLLKEKGFINGIRTEI